MFGPWGKLFVSEREEWGEEEDEGEEGKRRSNEVIAGLGSEAQVGCEYGVVGSGLGGRSCGAGRRLWGIGVWAKWNAWEVCGWEVTPPGWRLRVR